IAFTLKGNCAPWVPFAEYPGMLFGTETFAKGGEFSRDSVLPSLPLACSKKMPYPPRNAVLPLPRGSQAKPTRGAGLKRCPSIQLTGTPGVTPHWTIPFGSPLMNRSEEHTSELQSQSNLVCRLLLEKK